QGPSRAAALAAPANLPADADDDDVDRASHHRLRSVFRHAAAGVVVHRRRRPERLCALRVVHRLLDRAPHPVRLHLGADPPHAGRHPPSDLGYRSRPGTSRARVAGRRQSDRLDRDHVGALDHRATRHGRLGMSGGAHIPTRLPGGRGSAAAKPAPSHFWHQRVTAIANIPLTIAAVIILITLLGRNQAAAAQTLGSPVIAIIMLLFIGSITIHMRIGMAVIIEDYVHDESAKLTLLMANTFFTIVVGLAAIYGILKLSFGL